MRTHKVAVIPGDGIGLEVIEAGKQVIEALAKKNEGNAQQAAPAPSAVPEGEKPSAEHPATETEPKAESAEEAAKVLENAPKSEG